MISGTGRVESPRVTTVSWRRGEVHGEGEERKGEEKVAGAGNSGRKPLGVWDSGKEE